MTEEEINEKLNQTFNLGIISGIEQASNKVFAMSVDLFKKNKDDEAIKMKKISTVLLDLSLERQTKYNKDYPKDI